jgi:glyoxylase-like metal-dependent hydrolase (beta-lactamase superfamily II)
VRLYAFLAGRERCDIAVFNPFDEAVGTKIEIPYLFFLIQHPKGNVLFDSGVHPEVRTDRKLRLGAAADAFDIILQPEDAVVDRLRSIGVTPDQVRHVAHSHLHVDHAGGIEFFPKATFYIQRAELSFAYWPPVYQEAIYIRKDFDHDYKWKVLEGEFDIFDDGRVVLFPTPGHTPGHQSLLVRLENNSLILIGDAAYYPKNIEESLLPGILWSPDAMIASWAAIRAMQKRYTAELIFTHDPDYASKIRVAPEAWYD